MTRVVLRFVLLASVVTSISSARAVAQPASPAAGAIQAASKYTDEGIAAQKAGNYDAAVALFQKAYALTKHPVLIFNIAQAHRLAGHLAQALGLYERYLREEPSGSQAATARELIAELKARAAEEARKAEDARAAEEARKAEARRIEEARKAEETRKAQEAQQAEAARRAKQLDAARAAEPRRVAETPPPEPAQPPAADAVPGRNLRLSGIATAGVGAVSLAIGIGFGLHARSLADEVSQSYDAGKESAGRSANKIAITGMIGGAALIAAGAVLYWWGYTQGKGESGVALAPVVSDRLVGFAVSGSL